MAAKRRKKISRRPKGTGSIYERKNREGRIVGWQVALDINGRLVRRNAPDRTSAEMALAELQELKRREIDLGAGSQSLAQWLETWLAQMARDLRPRTINDYRYQIETYILPVLGDRALEHLRAHHIQHFLNQIVDGIRSAHPERQGTRTARLCATRLRQALDLAVARKLIADNPMAGVILPRDKPAPIDPPADAAIAALLVVAAEHPRAALWYCYALLGLRRGEGLGLRWADIDLERGTIRIAQQVQELSGRKSDMPSHERPEHERARLHIGPPKSDAGVRVLPIPTALRTLLREHRATQLAARLKRAKTWHDHDLVFCNRDGGPLWPRSVSDDWYALRDAAGLPKSTKLHHLRHALATLLDENGATEALKRAILGHEAQTVTQHYTHARVEAMRIVLERVSTIVTQRKVG
jgi:integrase